MDTESHIGGAHLLSLIKGLTRKQVIFENKYTSFSLPLLITQSFSKSKNNEVNPNNYSQC